jgi:phosphatidate phosphatase APP1
VTTPTRDSGAGDITIKQTRRLRVEVIEQRESGESLSQKDIVLELAGGNQAFLPDSSAHSAWRSSLLFYQETMSEELGE